MSRPLPAPGALDDPARGLTVDDSPALTDTEVAAVLAIVGRAAAADGVDPLCEHVRLHLRGGATAGITHTLVRRAGVIVGYAQCDAADGPAAECVVDPVARGAGIGRAVIAHLQQRNAPRPLRLWAHGDLPAAARLADACGFRPLRVLLVMRRSLIDLPAGRTTDPLPDVHIRAFQPGRDEERVLALNAQAFADLPDQGGWGPADLRLRMAQDWFDPEGFLLAVAADDPDHLLGFHWTKVHAQGDGHGHRHHDRSPRDRDHPNANHDHPSADHDHPSADHDHPSADPVGEVYVLAIDAAARGSGLGTTLVMRGLQYLRNRGMTAALLYVDQANTAAIRLYRRVGFIETERDTLYTASHPGTPAAPA